MADRTTRAKITADPAQFEAAMVKAATSVGRLNASLAKMKTGGSAGSRALATEINKLAPVLQAVGAAATVMGGLIVGAFIKATHAAGAYADEIGDFAATMGMATDDVRALYDQLGKADVQLQQYGNATIGVVDRLQQARDGNEEAAAAFRKLGIDVDSAASKSMTAVQVMGKVGDALANVSDQQERINIGKALGLSGRTLKSAMMAGESGLAKAKADPTFLTDAQYQRLQDVSNALDDLGAKAANTWKKAFASAAPMIISLLGQLNNLLDWVAKFIDAHPTVSSGLALLVAGFGALASALGPVLIAIAPVVNMMSTFGGMKALGGVLSSVIKLVPAIGNLGVAMAGIAPPVAVAAAAVGATILVWRDLKAAIEAVSAALDAYKTRQGTISMMREAGVSEKDAKRMSATGAAVDLTKMKRKGIREQIQADQRRMAGMPAMAAGGVVRRATQAIIGEAGPEAVVPLTRFEQVIAALRSIGLDLGRFAQGMPASGGGGPSVRINVNGVDTSRLAAEQMAWYRRQGLKGQLSYGPA